MKKKLFLILGNQLFNLKFLEKFRDDHIFFISEDYGLCTYFKHHKQKILLFLSAMRSYSDELKKNSFSLIYKSITEKDFKTDYMKKLNEVIENQNITEIALFEIEDKPFEKLFFSKLPGKIKIKYLKSPMFLNSREDFKDYLFKIKKPFLANFYKSQRIKYKILVDKNNKPEGGKWSFDDENRKKLPKHIQLPKQFIFNKTHHTNELKGIINEKFSDHPGSLDNFWMGTTREDAKKCLNHFLENKLNLFGDFEDAVDQRDNILFHSALSPLINLGLITPKEIIQKTMSSKFKFKLNSYEGYIRQIIGWREFIRGIYQNYMPEMGERNFFNHKRNMKSSWYNATTGLIPLDYSIKNTINFGWTHHIERLMILCNIMNLCEIQPKEVFKWFMEMFIDSSEWVMSPNVYGMGLFSDGGIFATKPYVCGSSYFLKMMNFKKGPWCDVMDGLYWKFIERNKDFFLKNPRLSMMVRIFQKINPERKQKIFLAANNFIKKNTYED